MESKDQQYERIPEAIVERLRRSDRGVSIMAPGVDAAILDQAAKHFSKRPERRSARWAVPAALAASLLLAVLLVRPMMGPAPVVEGDIDQSGQIDVLDVLALARRRAGGEGSITQARIDALASRIVSLSAGSEES